ncbi:MAG TPA: ABC transporter ATP-binding protein [Ktedonobacterales bacterium]|nr:ABC transporter ATP-binding protein [Ktedonobacterales bacterium]
MTVLVVNGMIGGYGKIPIVQDVSMHAERGKIVTIVGPNGAGKSTFMKLVAGVLRPMGGAVRLTDKDVTNLPANRMAREGLAYVPQENNVFPRMTIRENLEMGGFILSGDLQQRIDTLYQLFPDLRDATKKKAGQLSGGQRNMLAMARAMMLNPAVLMLDEPTAGLSPLYTDVVWQKVHEIAATGATIVVVEQNVDRAIANSDWVYVLVAGRNRLDGTPEQMRAVDLSAVFLGKKGDVPPAKAPTLPAPPVPATEAK